jgi:Domain of unknown function (DUF4136)
MLHRQVADPHPAHAEFDGYAGRPNQGPAQWRSAERKGTVVNARYLTIVGVAAIMTAGCAAAVKVQTENGQPALSHYHTYFLLPGHPSDDPDLDHRVQAEVVAAFARRSWVETPSDEAEAVVVIHAATTEKHSDAAFYEGWGGWGWQQFTEAGSSAAVHDYKPGSIVIDVFDAHTKQGVWRGIATDATENRRRDDIRFTQTAIDKLFGHFPTIEATVDVPDRVVSIEDQSPRITFAESPAVLITVDGNPAYRSIPGTDLSRVMNTRAFIVRDDSGIHYLRLSDRWMQAYTLTGWWSPAGIVPAGLDDAFAQALKAGSVEFAERTQPADDHVGGEIPAVYVSSIPMHLIVTDGPPEFAPLEGTPILYVKNTSAHVFKEPTDQELYVFVSEQWYRAWSTDGPWERLSNVSLPVDLARLPADVVE